MPAIASRRPLRISLRLRLTLLYGLCFLIAGAGVLAITYVLFSHGTSVSTASVQIRGVRLKLPPGVRSVPVQALKTGGAASAAVGSGGAAVPAGAGVTQITGSLAGGQTAQKLLLGARLPKGAPSAAQLLKDAYANQAAVNGLAARANKALLIQRHDSRAQLLTWSALALGVMGLVSILLGWLLAGRALSPLRTMNERARAISAANLHERLGLAGRRDELGALARTFDGLLARLERAFDAQRRFVANASHELRTPLTLERALVEVALADPNPSVASLRRTCERVLASSARQEQIIEALLTLARSQAAGDVERAPVDLAELCESLLAERSARLDGFEVRCELGEAVVEGDPRLLERLLANLIDNACVHNVPGGWIELETGHDGDRPALRIANSSVAIEPGELAELTAPFRRAGTERLAGGNGLGLSIVAAIAESHGGELALAQLAGDGFEVRLRFPVAVRQELRVKTAG